MTGKEILSICEEIKSMKNGSHKEWDIDGKRLIYDYAEKTGPASQVKFKEARLSLEKDGAEVGYCYLYPYVEEPQEVPDEMVKLLGDRYISMDITASGQPQEYEEDDDEYSFWEWVIDHNDSCAVHKEYAGGPGTLEVCFDGDAIDDFCEEYGLEDGYIEARLGYCGVVCVDASGILPCTCDMEKLWRNRPAGLRTEW